MQELELYQDAFYCSVKQTEANQISVFVEAVGMVSDYEMVMELYVDGDGYAAEVYTAEDSLGEQFGADNLEALVRDIVEHFSESFALSSKSADDLASAVMKEINDSGIAEALKADLETAEEPEETEGEPELPED